MTQPSSVVLKAEEPLTSIHNLLPDTHYAHGTGDSAHQCSYYLETSPLGVYSCLSWLSIRWNGASSASPGFPGTQPPPQVSPLPADRRTLHTLAPKALRLPETPASNGSVLQVLGQYQTSRRIPTGFSQTQDTSCFKANTGRGWVPHRSLHLPFPPQQIPAL